MVEIDGMPKVQASCTVPVRDGMVIHASTREGARGAQRDDGVPPHQPPARLPDLRPGRRVQAAGQRRRRGPPRLAHVRAAPAVPRLRADGHRPARRRRHDALHPVHALHPLLRGDHRDGRADASSSAAGHTFVWTHEGRPLDNDLSACAADVCPVGALTVEGVPVPQARLVARQDPLDLRRLRDRLQPLDRAPGPRRLPLHAARPAARERLLALRLRPLPRRAPQRAGVHEARDPCRGRDGPQADELG